MKARKTISELEAELRQRDRELAAVHKISEALFSKIKLDDLVKETLRVSMETVKANTGSILLYDAQKDKLVFKYVVGPTMDMLIGFEMEPTEGIAGEVFQSGKAKISEDVTKDKAHYKKVEERTKYVTKNMVTMPLKRIEGTPIGVMQILNKEEGLFDEQDLKLLTILSSQAATAIENARLAEEAKLAAVVRVLGNISHDVKNMMTPVMTGAQTLELILKSFFEDMDRICAQQRDLQPEIVEQIEAASSYIRSFYPEAIEMLCDGATDTQERVREIADCIKGEISEPQFEFVNVNTIIQKVVQALKLVAERNGLEIVTDGLGEIPATLVDERKIYNAVYNLVNNAIPETPVGGRITIKTYAKTKGQFPRRRYVMIEVADTGKGMPEHIRAKLFTEDVVSTKPGGTGLGTRIVKDAVDAHGGEITVESREGIGSTFYIKIPLRKPQG